MDLSKDIITPLVSVIIPCYNQGQYLPQAVQSLLSQTYHNWECIIVNDGSSDDTQQQAEIICKKDARFKLVTKTNGGLSSARNTALQVVKGDYIQLLDADDVILKDKLYQQVNSLLADNADISIADYERVFYQQDKKVNRHLSPFAEDIYYTKLILNWEDSLSIPCHCVLFKRSLVIQKKLCFNETLSNHEDWVFWVQLFSDQPKVVFNKEVLCYYYIYPTSMTTDIKTMQDGFIRAIDYLHNFFKARGRVDVVTLLQSKKKKLKLKHSQQNKSFIHTLRRRINKKITLFVENGK